MSYSESTMKTMGVTNVDWGVCGFTSSLYAMYEQNPAARGMLINAPQAWSVLYEIEEYLELLQRQNDARMLSLIEGFTSSFKGFGDFTVKGYLKYIRDNWTKYATTNSGDMNAAIQSDEKFSIALPPDAVVDYLKRMWKIDTTARFTSSASDGIIGVKDASNKDMWMYGGLCHYLYQKNGKIWSWGEDSYTSVQAADADFSVCCMISF